MMEEFSAKKPTKVEKVESSGDLRGEGIRYREDSISMATLLEKDTEGRGREHYERVFKIGPDELSGKTVLNMGAGPSVRYEREVLNALPADSGTEFFSVSPDYAKPKHREVVLRALSKEPENIRAHIHLITGFGQMTLFKEDSIDVAFLFHVLEHTNEKKLLFQELSRAIKLGGKIYFGPFEKDDGDTDVVRAVEKDGSLRFVETNSNMRIKKDPWGARHMVQMVYGYFEKSPTKEEVNPES